MLVAQSVRRWWQGILAPSWVRPGPTRRQRQVDVLLVVVFALVATISATLATSAGALYLGGDPMPWQLQACWILGLAVPLIWRRQYPLTVGVVISAVFLASQQLGFPDNLMASVALFWALYTVGAWSQKRLPAFWVRCLIIVAMFATIGLNVYRYRHELTADPGTPSWGLLDPVIASVLYNLLLNIFYFGTSTFFGTVGWTSARREHELAEQAATLAAAQEANAQRAVMRERVSIARELHDVVAHHVSVMGVQASAARRVLGKSPELASDALSAVENTARVAITELRGLLGVLRDESAPNADAGDAPVDTAGHPPIGSETLTAAPGIEQIPDLVRYCEGAGLKVSYGVFGTLRPVSSGVSLSFFRIVQEALTNVIKHAGATSVDIRLRFLAAAVEVEITDDGSAPAERAGAGGFGLVGMRERVAVHGGQLVVGRRPDGGFRVRATIPVPAEPADATVSAEPADATVPAAPVGATQPADHAQPAARAVPEPSTATIGAHDG